VPPLRLLIAPTLLIPLPVPALAAATAAPAFTRESS
jgi:hypothetical protein